MEKKVYDGKFVQVTEEEIEGAVYERVYMNHSVTIFPFDSNGKLLIIKEKRVHENPSLRWKPVTGFWEYDAGYDENVNRELQEEIGWKAGVIKPYFEIKSTGSFNIIQRFALAWDLTESKLPNPDGEDTIVDITALTLKEAVAKTLSGELAKGAGGYGLLRMQYEIKNGTLKIPNVSLS